MNWDKDFLARNDTNGKGKGKTKASAADVDAALEAGVSEKDFLETLMTTVQDLQKEQHGAAQPPTLRSSGTPIAGSASASVGSQYAGLSDKDRIRIKRRKVGKFIGLVGMETPVEEIAGRIQASLDRAVERSREELRRNEEIMLRRSKMA
jgi:hypothetical protein